VRQADGGPGITRPSPSMRIVAAQRRYATASLVNLPQGLREYASLFDVQEQIFPLDTDRWQPAGGPLQAVKSSFTLLVGVHACRLSKAALTLRPDEPEEGSRYATCAVCQGSDNRQPFSILGVSRRPETKLVPNTPQPWHRAAGPPANTSYRSAEMVCSRWSRNFVKNFTIFEVSGTGRQGRQPIRATARVKWSAPVGRETS
jgi:hypothetical protein